MLAIGTIQSKLLVYLDFGLNIVYGIAALNLKRDGLPCEGFHKYLHGTLLQRVRTLSSFSWRPVTLHVCRAFILGVKLVFLLPSSLKRHFPLIKSDENIVS